MEIDPKCKEFLKYAGAKIRQRRMELGWTLEDTEQYGWPHWQHFQKIEAGKNITLATLWKVAKVLRTDPWKLLKST